MNAKAESTVTLFKPTDGGYVFRVPFQTGLGRVRHYLVTERQKAELTAVIAGKRPLQTRLGLALGFVGVMIVAALTVFAFSPHANPEPSDTIAMIAISVPLTAAGYAAWRWWKLRQITPLLGGLVPTDLVITRGEMRRTMFSAMSTKQLWLITILSALAGAVNIGSAAYSLSLGHTNLATMISGVIFVCVATYYAMHLASRLRGPQAEQS